MRYLTRRSFATHLLNSMADNIAVLNLQGDVIAVNSPWKRFARENDCADKDFYVGKNYLTVCENSLKIQHDEAIEMVLNGIQAIQHGEQDEFSIEYPCNSLTEERWFICKATRLEHKKERYIVILHENITARKIAEQALAESNERYRKLTQSLPDAIYTLDLAMHRATYFNHDFFLGYSREELIVSGSILSKIHPEDAPAVMAHWQQLMRGEESGRIEYRIRSKAGQWEWVESHEIIVSKNEDGAPKDVLVVLTLITERKQAEQDLLHTKEAVEAKNDELQAALSREQIFARTDVLTEISNARHFFDVAKQEFEVARRYSQPLSIIIFDLDHFKQVNDTFGHQVGDKVLKHVAQIAIEQVREADTLARYGGEEFIVLLPNSNAQESSVVAERIRERISACHMVTDQEKVNVTISAGISELLLDVDTLDLLIRRADQALYEAKEAGRNCVRVYTPS